MIDLPPWLRRLSALSYKTRNQERTARYYLARYGQTPAWADAAAIRAVYRECARRRQRGERVAVDHIIPLEHPHVSGLHTPDNLRIISEKTNQSKSNHHWPDMWDVQSSLPGLVLEPCEQYELHLSM
jgi:hypothetical protein